MSKRYTVKGEDGVDNWSILDNRTGETVNPEAIAEVLNILDSSDIRKAVAALDIGGAIKEQHERSK